MIKFKVLAKRPMWFPQKQFPEIQILEKVEINKVYVRVG